MKKPEIKCEIFDGRQYYYVPLGRYVVRAIGVCGGEPVFKYTRIDILRVLGRLAAGEPVDKLVEDYEGRITKEGIREAAKIVEKILLKSLPPLPKQYSTDSCKLVETRTRPVHSEPTPKRTSKHVAA